ncbi:MAG: hypothetical protein IPN94_11485 [Sphingobacteriales bacterium]|nr:hypothetical protein [Sphingobacteriales bacterium]
MANNLLFLFYHHIPTSPLPHITTSPHHHITTSPPHHFTLFTTSIINN